MLQRRRLIPLWGGKEYWQKIRGIQTSNLIGLWRQNEGSGTTAVDSSPESNNGVYTGVTLANEVGPDGVLVPYYDGTNDYLNIYSAGFDADFNGQAGSAIFWCKMNSAANWTNGNQYAILEMSVDANNYLSLRKHPTNNLLWWRYSAGGTVEQVTYDTSGPVGWFLVGMTWSLASDAFKTYYNGAQVDVTQTGLGTWAGSLATTLTCIGSYDTGPTIPWHGWLGPAAIWKTVLTDTEMSNVYNWA